MDADGSHQPAELPRLLAALQPGADLVIGSRWVPGGTVHNWPRSREMLSRGGEHLHPAHARHHRSATRPAATAPTGPGALRAIALDEVMSQGYCFQIDLTLRTVQAGLTVVEVPITFTERTRGASKMSRAIVAEAFGGWRSGASRGAWAGGGARPGRRGEVSFAARLITA